MCVTSLTLHDISTGMTLHNTFNLLLRLRFHMSNQTQAAWPFDLNWAQSCHQTPSEASCSLLVFLLMFVSEQKLIAVRDKLAKF